jgi:cyclopropane-fatty-acyl-phospholipid synthase
MTTWSRFGSGWGALAIHAAGEYGCRVTATTISPAQRAYATARVRDAGLTARIEVVGLDYRDLPGRFDKLVSVEMIEAVGWQYFPLFFRRCSELLREDGLMLLQAIVVDDRAYEIEKARKSFANALIFPGGCLPSRRLIADLVGRVTDMRAVWSEDITPHYARTLRAWRERFDAAFERLRSRRYDERFRRLWTLYLTVSEAGFRERRLGDVQLLLAKPGWRPDRAEAAAAAALAVA